MGKNRDIPLIHASVVEPFILAAREIGTPVERVLSSAGLPLAMLDDLGMLVPEIPAWKFAQAIARMEDAPLFGLQAALSLKLNEIKSVKPLLEGCVNLKGLLECFCSIAPTQTNTSRYVMQDDGQFIWLIEKGIRLTTDHVQVELFEITGMMQLIQFFAGKSWRPSEIHFSFRHDRHINNAEELNPGKILYSQRYPAIAIPRDMLSFEAPASGAIDESSSILASPPPPDNIRDQLLCCLSPHLGRQKLNEQLLSDMTGMSLRTLRRTLAQQNTSYSRILELARFQKAQSLLKETDEKLIDISLMLGYENASTFTRAFKRWSGVSPKEFRKINEQVRRHLS